MPTDIVLSISLVTVVTAGWGLSFVADGWRWRYMYLRHAALHAYATDDWSMFDRALTATSKQAREAMASVHSASEIKD